MCGRWLAPSATFEAMFTLHVALMGWDVWFAPEKWANYGHLPPITLLSFVTAVVFLILRRRKA